MENARLSNCRFDDLTIGQSAALVRTVTDDDLRLFAIVSGDINPSHLDAAYARTDSFGHLVAHSLWSAGLISTLLGTRLPGPGTIYREQNLQFVAAVAPGDTITATVTVLETWVETRRVWLSTTCTNQTGQVVLNGTAIVTAPADAVCLPPTPLPDVTLHSHARFAGYLKQARALPPLKTAVVHPCSIEALQAAIEARDEGLIAPVLVGPQARIEALAAEAGLSLRDVAIENAAHSHAAAARAVAMAAAGEVSALMKGSLHSDEMLAAIVASDSGLRTQRRLSHVYAIDVPAYAKLLLVTDAVINIAPTLEQKRDICQSAIDFLHDLGIAEPLVAILAAVEMVNPAMPATLDAASLTVMAARGQITSAIVDGPLAFDNAISLDSARIKAIASPVAGRADILVVPNIEAGNMLAKQLIYLSGADAAGLVLGARVPIILTSRSDSMNIRLASVALAKIVAAARDAAGAAS
ncbi:enoyl-CoA hydratase [Bosea sp. PAMC 26642]|nr:enoyl-CoA hydratase [Bosea sp. PAMC 26642]